MISRHTILTVAKYEARILWRSWFFRIFSLLSLAVLILLDIAQFATPFSSWMNRGMAASVPYMNMVLLNLAQAVIAVFMASEFLKFDSRLDTTEAVYTRSMTNTDYVIGKTLGILGVFLGLNVFVLILSFIFNFFFTEVSPAASLYALYPLLLSLPTLLFMFGLSFLVMAVVRNQAITFLLLLGYIAGTLFFLGAKSHSLFDVMGLHIPFMYSDFVGFGNPTTMLLQRGMYLSLGLGFTFCTALRIRRLIQSAAMRAAAIALSALFISCGIIFGVIYFNGFAEGERLRETARTLNLQAAKSPEVTLNGCDLSLQHRGKEISAEARIAFTNDTSSALDRYTFSLNPGLRVLRVTRGGEKFLFERNLHLIVVKPRSPLAPGEADSLTICYRGTIDERICYSDLPEDERGQEFRFWVFSIDKRYGFLTRDFALLTPETLWYPSAGAPYGSSFPHIGKRDFVRYTLRVKTSPALTAISQGAVTKPFPGEFVFRPESPLPQLSLVIGEYTDLTAAVDGIEYHLYVRPGHDYFTPYFQKAAPKLSDAIQNAMLDTERRIGLTYPFPRLSLIEVPIQFCPLSRFWRTGQETVQPEQVYLPEKGVLIRSADFKRSLFWMQRGDRRRGQTQTEEEIQSGLFDSFVRMTFSGGGFGARNIRRAMASRGSGVNGLQRMAFSIAGGATIEGNYTLFPQFYTFTNHVRSTRYPLLDTALEQYLQPSDDTMFRPFRFFQGMTDEEKANALLAGRNLSEIMNSPADRDLAAVVLREKGAYLFTTMQALSGTDDFKTFLSDYLFEHISRDIDAESFLAALNERFNADFTTLVEDWYTRKEIPTYLLSDIRCSEIVEGDRARFQVMLSLTNTGSTEGTVSVTANLGGGGGGGDRMGFGPPGMGFMSGSDSGTNTRLVSLKAGQSKEIGMVLDSQPRQVMINTFLSGNLPAIVSKNITKPDKKPGGEIFDGERILDRPLRSSQPGEIVVDNEDTGFSTSSKTRKSFLKRFLKTDGGENAKEYIGFRFHNAPETWRPTVMDIFYGLERRSAYYVRGGKGDNRAVWETEIPANATYAVFCYCSSPNMPMMRRGPRPPREQERQESMLEEFHYMVRHDDGDTEVIMDMKNTPEGWAELGTFYFSAGPASVELTDKTRGRVVFADAVKWVKQNDSGQGKK